MHPNDPNANAPRQIIKKWDRKPLPRCPGIVELAFSTRLTRSDGSDVSIKRNAYAAECKALASAKQFEKDLNSVLDALPIDEEKALTVLQIAKKLDFCKPTVYKRVNILIERGMAAKIRKDSEERNGVYHYWRTKNV